MPQLRGVYVTELVRGIDKLPNAADVRARVPVEVLARIASTGGIEYVEAADYQALLEAAYAELGRDAFVALIRAQTNRFKDAPLVASSIRALLKLFGSTPHTLLKHFGRLRDLTVRGFGTVTYLRIGEREAAQILKGYPPALMTDANIQLFRATYLALLDMTGHVGTCDSAIDDVSAGRASFSIRWEPPR
jgi:hypothetical protein